MLIEHQGARPRVAESAYVAPIAVLCGDVEARLYARHRDDRVAGG